VPSLPVKPEFGPTLPELAGPRWRRRPAWLRVALSGSSRCSSCSWRRSSCAGRAEERVVVAEPLAFNLRHGEALTRIAPPPAASACASSSAATATSSRRSPCAAAAAGLPRRGRRRRSRYAERVIADLREGYADFELADEGRVRINEAPGYAIGFRARRDGRRVWGRTVLLVP
jgi:hypothetical protein